MFLIIRMDHAKFEVPSGDFNQVLIPAKQGSLTLMKSFSSDAFRQPGYANLVSHESHQIESYPASQWLAGIVDDTTQWPSLLLLWHAAGALTSDTLRDFTHVLTQASDKSPTDTVAFLVSHHSELPTLIDIQQTHQWLSDAGLYRQAQCRFKQHGGLMVSMVTDTLIGGTYLVHGLAAHYRLILSNTRCYPSLEPSGYERIFHQPYPHPTEASYAEKSGLVHTTIDANVLWQPTIARWVATIRHLPLSF